MGSIDPAQFLATAQSALASGNAEVLAQRIGSRWKPGAICKLLEHADADVRRVTAIVLGLVGDQSSVGCLARALHDSDSQVNEMAEHAMWSIWFRSCAPEATASFREGMALLASECYDAAIDNFRLTLRIDPAFAEAYNQCGIARFFLGQWRDSIEDCQQALLRQPAHFGAMANMGHSYAHLGEMHQALDCYRRAIAINPCMTAIEQAIERIEREIKPAYPHFLQSAFNPLLHAGFRAN